MTQATEVLFPTSADEAVAQFGDGSGVTVVGGGTIVMPEITYGRLAPTKALVLVARGARHARRLGHHRDARRRAAGRAPRRRWPQDVKALAECALNVADYEIRRQATVGGNLCAGEGQDAPSRRPPGPVARARRAGALGRRRRRVDGAARGVPRPPRRPAPARRHASRSRPLRRSPRSTTRTPTSTRCSP